MLAAMHEALVIGAGPAGLASAAALMRRGVEPVVIERADSLGSSWRARYDGLRLNTNRWLSRLPGYRFPHSAGRFPTRDEVVSYLEAYAEHHGIAVCTGVEARRIERVAAGWRVISADRPFEAGRVVVATGYERLPRIPQWPGREDFPGELIHAADYRNPGPYRGRDVLVVGAGCSGAEIAYHLTASGAGSVCLAVRTPPHLVLRQWGIPADVLGVLGQRLSPRISDPQVRLLRRISIGDLSEYGLPLPRAGAFRKFRRERQAPTTVDREVIHAIRARRIKIVPAVERFDGRAVRLADGSRVEPDAVIAATGYERALQPLVGHLGVLGDDGCPVVHGAETHPRAPDLHFVGFDPRIPGTFRQIRIESRRLRRAA